MTKTEKIRKQLAEGMSPKETAAMLGVTIQAVYDVRYRDARKAKRQAIDDLKTLAAKDEQAPVFKSGKKAGQSKTSKAARIRALFALGHKPREIAAMTGFRLQTVHTTMYYERIKAAKKTPTKMGRPKGSKNKTPVSTHVHIASLKKLRQSPEGIDTPRLPPGKTLAPDAQQHVIYMGNPNPTLWSRIKAVFTGRYE